LRHSVETSLCRMVLKYQETIIFVLSQYTRLTDGQRDGRTDIQTDVDSKTVRMLRSRTVKTGNVTSIAIKSKTNTHN